LLSGHPRKQLNFTLDSLHAAESALSTLRSVYSLLKSKLTSSSLGDWRQSENAVAVIAALSEDLNTPGALGLLFRDIKQFQENPTADSLAGFEKIMSVFGFDLIEKKTEIPAEVSVLAEKRWAAKKAKDFAGADKMRAELTAVGWSMLDGKDGYKLEPIKK
jgi:cysteinyl-tRNA synthetase